MVTRSLPSTRTATGTVSTPLYSCRLDRTNELASASYSTLSLDEGARLCRQYGQFVALVELPFISVAVRQTVTLLTGCARVPSTKTKRCSSVLTGLKKLISTAIVVSPLELKLHLLSKYRG